MSDAKARLARLLDLADQGPSLRAALAEEVAELLMDWPADTPAPLRTTFEALLEKVARDVDVPTRQRLMARIGSDPADPLAARILPLEILNPAFFNVPPPIKTRILARNEVPDDADDETAFHDAATEARLLAASRSGADYTASLAQAFALPGGIAAEIAGDTSAQSLAVACKGAHLSRAAFSALAILSTPATDAADQHARLSAFDAVPPHAAARLLQSWRLPPIAHAAE